jgi:hypothetical protein
MVSYRRWREARYASLEGGCARVRCWTWNKRGAVIKSKLYRRRQKGTVGGYQRWPRFAVVESDKIALSKTMATNPVTTFKLSFSSWSAVKVDLDITTSEEAKETSEGVTGQKVNVER